MKKTNWNIKSESNIQKSLNQFLEKNEIKFSKKDSYNRKYYQKINRNQSIEISSTLNFDNENYNKRKSMLDFLSSI